MPDFEFERAHGWPTTLVCGIDEAGRGPLAGPVTAAAVILPSELPAALAEAIDDSKALKPDRREAIEHEIRRVASFGLGWATVEEIDLYNILRATFLAMGRAVAALPQPPALAFVDGNRMPTGLPCRAVTIVGGDRHSLSIAAASILAKVARDREMARLAAMHPGYGWERNAGYGTAEHLDALRKWGATPAHRRSFAPVSQQLSITL